MTEMTFEEETELLCELNFAKNWALGAVEPELRNLPLLLRLGLVEPGGFLRAWNSSPLPRYVLTKQGAQAQAELTALQPLGLTRTVLREAELAGKLRKAGLVISVEDPAWEGPGAGEYAGVRVLRHQPGLGKLTRWYDAPTRLRALEFAVERESTEPEKE